MREITVIQELYRKLIHLSSLWMSFVIFFLPPYLSASIFIVCLIGNIVVEYGYCKQWPYIFSIYNFLFGKMMRSNAKEKKFRLSGSPFVFASALLCSLLFPKETGTTAFSIMIIGDTAAALIGRIFGKIRFSNGKCLEGLLSFLITSLIVLFICCFLFDFSYQKTLQGVIGILIAGLFELYGKNIKVDDNFSIPLVIGIVMSV